MWRVLRRRCYLFSSFSGPHSPGEFQGRQKTKAEARLPLDQWWVGSMEWRPEGVEGWGMEGSLPLLNSWDPESWISISASVKWETGLDQGFQPSLWGLPWLLRLYFYFLFNTLLKTPSPWHCLRHHFYSMHIDLYFISNCKISVLGYINCRSFILGTGIARKREKWRLKIEKDLKQRQSRDLWNEDLGRSKASRNNPGLWKHFMWYLSMGREQRDMHVLGIELP